MSNKRYFWLGVVIAIGAVTITVSFFLFALLIAPVFYKPNLYLIPSGFSGHVVIHYDIPSAGPLQKDGNRLIVRIPQSGMLETSSPPPSGKVEWDWVDKQGQTKEIPFECVTHDDTGEGETVYPDGAVVKHPPAEQFDVSSCGE